MFPERSGTFAKTRERSQKARERSQKARERVQGSSIYLGFKYILNIYKFHLTYCVYPVSIFLLFLKTYLLLELILNRSLV
jgi:hypothetical protein